MLHFLPAVNGAVLLLVAAGWALTTAYRIGTSPTHDEVNDRG